MKRKVEKNKTNYHTRIFIVGSSWLICLYAFSLSRVSWKAEKSVHWAEFVDFRCIIFNLCEFNTFVLGLKMWIGQGDESLLAKIRHVRRRVSVMISWSFFLWYWSIVWLENLFRQRIWKWWVSRMEERGKGLSRQCTINIPPTICSGNGSEILSTAPSSIGWHQNPLNDQWDFVLFASRSNLRMQAAADCLNATRNGRKSRSLSQIDDTLRWLRCSIRKSYHALNLHDTFLLSFIMFYILL